MGDAALYNRGDYPDHEVQQPGALLYLNRVEDGEGRSRLELYASTHDDCPVEIRAFSEVMQLLAGLGQWLSEELPPSPWAVRRARETDVLVLVLDMEYSDARKALAELDAIEIGHLQRAADRLQHVLAGEMSRRWPRRRGKGGTTTT